MENSPALRDGVEIRPVPFVDSKNAVGTGGLNYVTLQKQTKNIKTQSQTNDFLFDPTNANISRNVSGVGYILRQVW